MSRRRIFAAVLIGVAILSVILLTVISDREGARLRALERVVVIHLQGVIEEAGGTWDFSGFITLRRVARQLERAAEDNSIKAVVLRINSPGGAVAASQQIAAVIRDFKKPVVVSMGDMAASGGYYISAPADGIVAHPGTMTGSIGVIFSILNMDGLYEKLGVELETIKSGRHKDMFSRKFTDEERRLLQRISDEAYDQFITEVAEGRNLEKEYVRELATGQLYLGSQALELGLVDRLGGIEEAIALAAEIAGLEKPVKYEFPPPSFFEQLTRFNAYIPALLEKISLPDELFLLEKIKQYGPQLRYQVIL
ncbi:MAG: signal peptide peptidase SppA [Firmicutes bacterium]|nr:signal peptide peptidase SppA [Bacillota bacterium]